jgi:hypothetical protein
MVGNCGRVAFQLSRNSISELRPTILDFLDIPVPEGHVVDGQNLAKLFAGQSDPERRNEFISLGIPEL